MSEPKKETVRIVLPPRRDGQTPGSNPRETAMVNLPSKPAPVPPAASVPPSPLPPSIKPPSLSPVPPSGLAQPPKPPSIPGLKPPGAPGLKPPTLPAASVNAPKPPGLAPQSPAASVSMPPPASKAPSLAPKAPSISAGPVAPAPLKADTKKETAKVPPSAGPKPGLPQATVQLTKKPDPSKSVSASAIKIASAPVTAASEELSPVLGGIAAAAALIALGIQVWFFL